MSEENKRPEKEKAPGKTQPTPSPPQGLIIDIYSPEGEKPKANGDGRETK